MGRVFARFLATVELATCAMIFAISVGIPVGVLAAVNVVQSLTILHWPFFNRLLNAYLLVGDHAHHVSVGAIRPPLLQDE